MEFVWGTIIESRLLGHVENLKKLTEKLFGSRCWIDSQDEQWVDDLYVTKNDVAFVKSYWKYRQRQQNFESTIVLLLERWKSILTSKRRLLSVLPYEALFKPDKFAPYCTFKEFDKEFPSRSSEEAHKHHEYSFASIAIWQTPST